LVFDVGGVEGSAGIHPPVGGDQIASKSDAGCAVTPYGALVTRPPFTRIDVGVAAAVAGVAVVEAATNAAIAPEPAAVACELGMAAALLWRRRSPLAVVSAAAVLQVSEAAAGVPLEQPVVPLLASVIAIYALMTTASAVHAAAGGVIMLVAVGAETIIQHKGFANFAFALVFLVGAVIVGRTVHSRTQHAVELAERAHTLERQQRLTAQLAVQEERTRIARELHDVIAHAISVMVVQAGAAEQTVERDPRRAMAAMRAVQATGREAVGEMARLLGILREDGVEIGLTPAPGLADLPALVEDARRSGLEVDLHVEGYPRPLPPGAELSTYRIVQEALTNVRKHAGHAHAAIRVVCSDVDILADVHNDAVGDAEGSTRVPGAGHGLIGMRERVGLYGGTLIAEPTDAGGFRVCAQIPLAQQP
jgi:signal transduction histidine kinase